MNRPNGRMVNDMFPPGAIFPPTGVLVPDHETRFCSRGKKVQMPIPVEVGHTNCAGLCDAIVKQVQTPHP